MLEARDAYLAADLMRSSDPTLNWPSNQNELWLEFARHGFGEKRVLDERVLATTTTAIRSRTSRRRARPRRR